MREVYEGQVRKGAWVASKFYPKKTTNESDCTIILYQDRVVVLRETGYDDPGVKRGFEAKLVDIFDDPCNPKEDEFTLMELETGFNISKEYRSYLEGVKK